MSSTSEAILEGMSRAWRKARRRTAAGEDPRRFKGGPRKNSFNNRGLIMGAVGKGILPENFGVARRGDTGQEGRAVVTSCGGILDAVGAEGPEAVGVDGGAAKSVAGTVEVAHADLAGAFWVVAVVEHSEIEHIFLKQVFVTAAVALIAPRNLSHPFPLGLGLRRWSEARRGESR